MDDDFDDAFQAELEALEDLESDIVPPLVSRKSLDFSTPRTRHIKSRLDPNESISDGISVLNQLDVSAEGEEVHRCSQKRGRRDTFTDLSDDEDNNTENQAPSAAAAAAAAGDEMPDMSQTRKRARLSSSQKNVTPAPAPAAAAADPNDFEITPPASPTIEDEITAIKRQNKMAAAAPSSSVNSRSNGSRSGSGGDHPNRLIDSYDLERPRVLSRIPTSDYVHVTGSDGQRVYLKLKEETSAQHESDAMKNPAGTMSLLGTPLSVLKAQLEEERYRRSVALAEELQQSVDKDLQRGGGGGGRGAEVIEQTGKHPSTGALWVEQYSPQRYTELLSDEATNRLLLKWLKLWDHVVFNKEKKMKIEKETKKDEKKAFSKLPQVTDELDDHNRPMHKVALLSGPPGLGKTTLAHVIAHHAGYNVVEMNASDDRSVEMFRQRIEAATQMRAVMGADPRPNCLIIDEIDGAPAPAINYLISVIKSTGNTEGKRGKKQQGPALLLRPIICICNDLYVPSLRQLRQVALTITFPPTIPHKLATRLMEIVRHEKLKTDLTTLLSLCEKADNDIRSCLNTLQFVKSKCSTLTLQQVQSASLGQKDAHKSLFTIWKHIFSMPRAQRKRYVNPYDRTQGSFDDLSAHIAQNPTSMQARVQSTYEMTIASGEGDKLHQGLYDNYLEAKVKDPHMDGLLLALEWLTYTDLLNQQVAHSQNYHLMRYTSFLPVVFHLVFAANQPHKIQYPNSQYEFHLKKQKSENLLSSLVSDVAPSVRKNLNVTVTVTEYLPPLMDIIQPNLRPVNTQLYSAREKQELHQLIQIMIAYNLTYHQERSMDGQYNYQLDPNIDDLVRFPDMKQKRQLTYAAKQLISREIEVEQMRRSEMPRGTAREAQPLPPAAVATARNKTTKAPAPSTASSSSTDTPSMPNHMQTLKPKIIVEEKKVARDFFGRCITVKAQEIKKKKEQPCEEVGGDVWFRFKEGFSNAVRKNVHISDLM